VRNVALPLSSLFVLFASYSCGPAREPTPPHGTGVSSSSASSSGPNALSGSTALVGGPGRARITMLPSDRWVAHDTIDAGSGTKLMVGNGGERWSIGADGGVTPAPMNAPEDLVAVRKANDGSFVLVGRSGAIYPIKTALADITGKRVPPQPFRRVTAGKSAIVGVTEAGALMRSADFGATWNATTMPKGEGLLVDLKLNDRGEGIGLFAPQRIVATADDGATFSTLASSGNGATRLGTSLTNELYVEGMGLTTNKASDGFFALKSPGAYAVLRTSPTRFENVDSIKPRVSRLPLPDDFLWLGYASAINEGHGLLLGSRYFEPVTDRASDDQALALATYELGKKITSAKILKLANCIETMIAGVDKSLVVGCAHEADPENDPRTIVELVKSDDLGATWTSLGTLEWGDGTKRLLVTSKGSVLVEGVCLPPRDDLCGTQGPLVRPAGAKKFVKVAMPLGPAKEIPTIQRWIAAPDGDRIFATGMVADETQLRLFVSKDGGKTFNSKPFPLVEEDATVEADEMFFDDKSLVVFAAGSTMLRYATKDDGATFESRAIPLDAYAIVSMAGKRGLAWTNSGALETMDSGLTWGEVTLPKPRDTGEATNLACTAEACLLGERAVRFGWELEKPGDAKRKTEAVVAKTMVARSTLKCAIEGSETSLGTIEGMVADPGAGTAFVALEHGANGALSVLRLPRGKAIKDAIRTPLLPASTIDKRDLASYEVTRTDGYVALRFPVKRDAPTTKPTTTPPPPSKPTKPTPKPPKGKTPIKTPIPSAPPIGAITKNQPVDVEVAWYVASTGKAHRGTIKAGDLDPGKHVYTGKEGALRIHAAAWIAPGHGVYVRPFAVKDSADLFLITEAGKTQKLAVPNVPSLPMTTVRDAKGTILVATQTDYQGARPVYLANMLDAGTTTGRWWGAWPRLEERTYGIDARVSTMTMSGDPYLVVHWPGDARLPSGTWAASLKNPGDDPSEVLALPIAKDLEDPPRTCDASALGTGGRIELPFMTGTRHPVTVKDEKRELVWATNDSIVRFVKGKPACTSAMLVSRGYPTPSESAIVLPDDLGNATLFLEKFVGGQRTAVAQTMRCAFTKDPIPKALTGQKGF